MRKYENIMSWVVIVCSLSYLYLFGIYGYMRFGHFGFDFDCYYKAAELLVRGENPYQISPDFAYPPQSGPWLLLLGVMEHKTALIVQTILNILAIAVIVAIANRWFLKIKSFSIISFPQAMGVSTIIGFPFVAHSVFQGQVTMIVFAITLISWECLMQNKFILSGILLGIASIKPQVSALYFVWLLLGFNWRVLMASGGTVLLLCIPMAYVVGPVGAFESWFEAVKIYSAFAANQMGFQHVVGIESLFASVGITLYGTKAIAIALVFALYAYRKYFDPRIIINLFLVISLTFVYGHDSDYAILSLAWSCLAFLCFSKPKYIPVFIFMAVAFFFPQRFIRAFAYPMLNHWRTLLVPILAFLLYRFANFSEPESSNQKCTFRRNSQKAHLKA